MKCAKDDNSGFRCADPSFGTASDPADELIPWASAASWRECQQRLQESITASRPGLDRARALAGRILHRYALAGDIFEELADSTCRVCRRPCCLDARVWLDFRDLLLIHLGNQTPPPGQLRENWWSRCRCLTSHGCTLPRASRPWVCTWYLCPDQRRVLKRDIPGGPEMLGRWWPEITSLRERMEAAFLAALEPITSRSSPFENPCCR